MLTLFCHHYNLKLARFLSNIEAGIENLHEMDSLNHLDRIKQWLHVCIVEDFRNTFHYYSSSVLPDGPVTQETQPPLQKILNGRHLSGIAIGSSVGNSNPNLKSKADE